MMAENLTNLSDRDMVECPKVRFAVIPAKGCLACDCYKGMQDNGPSQLPFVICNKPLTRKLTRI